MRENKEVIETIINTAAIALTAAGTQQAISGKAWGILLIIVAMLLEFIKYYGRNKQFW